MRRTKIICTIGPASRSPETLRAMIEAGMDIVRLNFSHGTHPEHAEVIHHVWTTSDEVGRPIAIMQDLQGPRIRVGEFANGQIELKTDQHYTFTTQSVIGDSQRGAVSYAGLPGDLAPGNHLLIDDGDLVFEVESIAETEIHCRVASGGVLFNRKGINLPGVDLSIDLITEKDQADLRFGIEQGVDLVAMSFVGSAGDVRQLRHFLGELGADDMPIVAKIERQRGLVNLEEVIEGVYAVMVARGDLALETSAAEVPVAQKRIIRACRQAGVPVITATQMLESMTENPEPTRAEATDVANAVFDGTDAVMLSGETAIGKHPVTAVRTMAEIVERAEAAVHAGEVVGWEPVQPVSGDIDDTIASLACQAAANLDARAILAFTRSGSTALRLARRRPWSPVVAITPDEAVAQRLLLTWGVRPVICPPAQTRDELVHLAMEAARSEGVVSPGDTVVLAAGLPGEAPGHTNLLEICGVE